MMRIIWPGNVNRYKIMPRAMNWLSNVTCIQQPSESPCLSGIITHPWTIQVRYGVNTAKNRYVKLIMYCIQQGFLKNDLPT